ncbi:MAG: ABC transporter substrate-binding protein [Geminicoccales bacterium]
MRTSRFPTLAALAAVVVLGAGSAGAVELRIGLQEDPDVLDPDQSRTFVGRIVYTALCDKLVDITPDLKIVPQLATGWTWSDDGKALTMDLREGVTFHDGTPFDAEAVKANIERSKNLPESRRKSELTSVESVEVTGPYQVTMNLKNADATLLAQLADRSGMMISPTAAEAAGLDFGNNPICSGPFKFVERVQQDRIVLDKYDGYWNKGAIHIDRVVYLPIPDTTVRLANLRSGDLQMIERVAATDVKSAKADSSLTVVEAIGLGYQGMTINVGNGAKAKNPVGENKLVRQAIELAIDRNVVNQVVFEGNYVPGNQPFPPNSSWYDKSTPIPGRDVAKAKALLKQAGFDKLQVEVQMANNPVQTQVMQVIQSMAAEAGIDIQLKATEFAAMLKEQSAGNYQVSQVGWSGRIDPDGNLHQFVTCKGGINDSKYCNPKVDELLNAARTSNDEEVRKDYYDQANAILREELPIIYLYHPTWVWALSNKVSGFVPYPDGMIRLENVKVAM